MGSIYWDDFKKIEMRIGTIIEVKDFPEARNPAYQLKVDLGEKIGIRQSSAQITDLYSKEDLVGQQVLVVFNLPPKQIGTFISDCLITGFKRDDNTVVLAIPQGNVENGTLLV